LKAGECVRRVRFVIVAPDPRHSRRSQAGFPLIALSEFGRPPLKASDDEALKAVLQTGRVEIQQQIDADMAHARIGQDLRFVCRKEGSNAFDFNNNRIRGQNIRAKPKRDRCSFVNHRDTHLARKRMPARSGSRHKHPSSPGPIVR
jgi:hypothetical protein